MANFFNGADALEVAGLGLSNSNLNAKVKDFLNDAENVEALLVILNDDTIKFPATREIRLCVEAFNRGGFDSYEEGAVVAAISRELNSRSKKIAEAHGFERFRKLSRGKLGQGQLLLKNPEQPQQFS